MPPKLTATFQKVNLSGYSDGYSGLTATQAAPKGYIDQVIADLVIPAAGVSEAFVNTAISTQAAVRVAAEGVVLASANTAAAELIAASEVSVLTNANAAAAGLIAAQAVIRVAAEEQVLANANTAAAGLIAAETVIRVAAEEQVLLDAQNYVSGAISTIISGGTATLKALDTINNIYAAITGDASGVVSGLLFTKANLAAPNTFTAANTFASGLKISGATQQYLYFGTNWRVGGVGSELKFEHSPLGTFTSGDSAEIVFVAEEPSVDPPTATLTADGTTLTASFTGADSATLNKPGGSTTTITSSGQTVVAEATGDYTLTVTNSAGTTVTTSPVTVTVPSEVAPTASLSVSGLTLTVSFTGADTATLTKPDNSTQTVNNSDTFSAPGPYSLAVSNSAGTANATATVYSLEVTIFAQSISGNDLTFTAAFTPADSTAAVDQEVGSINNNGSLTITAPADPTTYILTVTNNLYDPSTTTQSLSVSGSGLTISTFEATVVSGQVTFSASYTEGAVAIVTPGDLEFVSGTTISFAQPESDTIYTLTLTKDNYITKTSDLTVSGSVSSS